jgi:hypothetical protein
MIDLDNKVMSLKLALRTLNIVKFSGAMFVEEVENTFIKHGFDWHSIDHDGNILISYQVASINHNPIEAFFRSFDDDGMIEFRYTGTEKYPGRPPRNY